jgi:hypothetical protein
MSCQKTLKDYGSVRIIVYLDIWHIRLISGKAGVDYVLSIL